MRLTTTPRARSRRLVLSRTTVTASSACSAPRSAKYQARSRPPRSCGRQAVSGDLAQRRRAVQKDQVVIVGDPAQEPTQPQRRAGITGGIAVFEGGFGGDEIEAGTPPAGGDGVGGHPSRASASTSPVVNRIWAGFRPSVALACGSRSTSRTPGPAARPLPPGRATPSSCHAAFQGDHSDGRHACSLPPESRSSGGRAELADLTTSYAAKAAARASA